MTFGMDSCCALTFSSPPKKAIARPANAISVATTGAHGVVLHPSTKYQSPKRSMNGTTIAAAAHSCARNAGGSCWRPSTANAVIIAKSASSANHRRSAPAASQTFFRMPRVAANAAPVAEVAPASPAAFVSVAVVFPSGAGTGACFDVVAAPVVEMAGVADFGDGAGLEEGADRESPPVGVTVVATIVMQTGESAFAESSVTKIGTPSPREVDGMSAWMRIPPEASPMRVIWLNGMFAVPAVAAIATYELSDIVNSNEWSELSYAYGVKPVMPAVAHVLLPDGSTCAV